MPAWIFLLTGTAILVVIALGVLALVGPFGRSPQIRPSGGHSRQERAMPVRAVTPSMFYSDHVPAQPTVFQPTVTESDVTEPPTVGAFAATPEPAATPFSPFNEAATKPAVPAFTPFAQPVFEPVADPSAQQFLQPAPEPSAAPFTPFTPFADAAPEPLSTPFTHFSQPTPEPEPAAPSFSPFVEPETEPVAESFPGFLAQPAHEPVTPSFARYASPSAPEPAADFSPAATTESFDLRVEEPAFESLPEASFSQPLAAPVLDAPVRGKRAAAPVSEPAFETSTEFPQFAAEPPVRGKRMAEPMPEPTTQTTGEPEPLPSSPWGHLSHQERSVALAEAGDLAGAAAAQWSADLEALGMATATQIAPRLAPLIETLEGEDVPMLLDQARLLATSLAGSAARDRLAFADLSHLEMHAVR